jgi:WXG100 family type VII secretion target
MSDSLSWDRNAMIAGLDEITQADSRLSANFDALGTALAPMEAHWIGQGQESWSAVQKRWNDSMQDMLGLLQQIRQSLDHAITVYGEAETRIANSWEG